RADAVRRADRFVEGEPADVLRLRDRRPHSAVEDHVRRPRPDQGGLAVRARGLRAHCRHDQSARREQVRVLDRRHRSGERRRVVRERHAARGLLVERLAPVDNAAPRPRSAAADRGRAGKLRAAPRGWPVRRESLSTAFAALAATAFAGIALAQAPAAAPAAPAPATTTTAPATTTPTAPA